jgi:hypothetical protein
MREAEMADLKKSVDDLAHDIKSYDPLKSTREDVESIGKDLNKDFAKKPLDLLKPEEPGAAEPAADQSKTAEPATAEPTITAEPSTDTAVAEPQPQAPTPETALTASPESTERTG